MSHTPFETVPAASHVSKWLAGAALAVALASLPSKAAEQAPVTAARRTPMVEMDAKFVRATAAQFDEALGKPGRIIGSSVIIGSPVLEPDRAERALASLKANKAEFFSNPQAITKSGQKAVVEAVRELRYPTQFERSKSEPGKVLPTSFETRDVGVKMEFQPVVTPDGALVVTLVPSIVTFQGFIDYSNGRPGLKSAEPGALDELLKAPLREGGIWQPIFSTQKVTTSVEIFSGQTVVLGVVSPVADPTPERSIVPKDDIRRELNTYIFVTVRVIAAE